MASGTAAHEAWELQIIGGRIGDPFTDRRSRPVRHQPLARLPPLTYPGTVWTPQIRLYVMLVAVLGFTAWTLDLIWSVDNLRHQLDEQVGWQIATARWERNPSDPSAAEAVRAMVPEMRARLGTTPDARDTLDAVEVSLSRRDITTQEQAAEALSSRIRRANDHVSIELGSRWDQVTILLLLALAFAFAAVLLQALRQKDRRARVSSERALNAAQDRLSRVGVGLMCIDHDNTVHAPNEVAKGLAAARGSIDEWWLSIDASIRRPGTVPCHVCAKPVHVGRCEVQDATRMGQRVVEVVFGGHAHDLEHGEKLVILVRDITEQRRRQVLGGVADRLADTRDLSRGLSRAMTSRTTQLVRGLRRLARSNEEMDFDEVAGLAEELRTLGRSVALLANDAKGPSDITESCRTVESLVRPQLSPQVQLHLDVPKNMRAHTRPARFTHALFTELLRATEACADGAEHKVELLGRREGTNIVVEIRDDRDPKGPQSKQGAVSATHELFQAAGASLVRDDSLERHVASIRVASVD